MSDSPIPFEAMVGDLLGSMNEEERKNAPARLYCAGDRSLFRAGPRVSIVGSRAATEEGLRRARKLSRALASRGVVVVSGLAEGIDTVAHGEALESAGKTLAVLGSPLDVIYPTSNRALFDRIAREHLMVSQFPSGTPIQPKNFPMRNRTMALLSHATVIVEAAEKSGSLHQAWEALRLGRPLFIMASTAQDESLKWPREVLAYGAQILSDTTLDRLLEQLPMGQLEEAVAF